MKSAPSVGELPFTAPVRVLKFGGTSIGTSPERLAHTAQRVAESRRQGYATAVVVSARGDSTDRLVEEALTATVTPPPRELDQLLATGEVRSAALLAMALDGMGVSALSLLGQQAGFRVAGDHTDGRIAEIDATRVRDALSGGDVVVVAGFQGVNSKGDVITLGRGGSDTSAVALAVELGAQCCEIYTDVDGVFSADPRIVPDSLLISAVRNSVMAEMAYAGARVLHPRAVELAGRAGMDIHVRSAFHGHPGTVVVSDWKGAQMMEFSDRVIAVAHDPHSARITMGSGSSDAWPVVVEGFSRLADASVTVDMVTRFGNGGWGFIVARKDVDVAMNVLSTFPCDVAVDAHVAKVSIVGAGLMSEPRYAGRMLTALFASGIEPLAVATSQSRISAIVPETECARAVSALHQEFLVDAQASRMGAGESSGQLGALTPAP